MNGCSSHFQPRVDDQRIWSLFYDHRFCQATVSTAAVLPPGMGSSISVAKWWLEIDLPELLGPKNVPWMMSLLTSWSSKRTWAVVKGCWGAHGFHIWGCQKEAPKSWVIRVHLTSPTGKLTDFERIEAEIGSLTNEKHLNGHHPFLSDEWGTIRLIPFPTWFCPTKMRDRNILYPKQ
jgi:hypothetical protein